MSYEKAIERYERIYKRVEVADCSGFGARTRAI
jgi:hypothetical protein